MAQKYFISEFSTRYFFRFLNFVLISEFCKKKLKTSDQNFVDIYLSQRLAFKTGSLSFFIFAINMNKKTKIFRNFKKDKPLALKYSVCDRKEKLSVTSIRIT